MRHSSPGYKAMMDRIALGTPFMTRDLVNIAKATGCKAAYAMANGLSQTEKRLGHIVVVGRVLGASAYIWQSAVHAPPKPAPPVVRSPAVQGPLDPSSAVEGGNTGLTELVAEWLWREVGGQGQHPAKDGVFVEINPMEAFGWRIVADKLIRRLLDLGMHAPGPPPDFSAGWASPWNYNIGDWTVQDENGGFIASLMDEDAAYLIAAAPSMRNAILGILQHYDERGGIKREDIDVLRASLPSPTSPLPHP